MTDSPGVIFQRLGIYIFSSVCFFGRGEICCVRNVSSDKLPYT